MNAQRLILTLDVIRGCHKQWCQLAQKHHEAGKVAVASLTREHHEREERYWQGKADGLRFCLEQIEDAKVLKPEVVS